MLCVRQQTPSSAAPDKNSAAAFTRTGMLAFTGLTSHSLPRTRASGGRRSGHTSNCTGCCEHLASLLERQVGPPHSRGSYAQHTLRVPYPSWSREQLSVESDGGWTHSALQTLLMQMFPESQRLQESRGGICHSCPSHRSVMCSAGQPSTWWSGKPDSFHVGGSSFRWAEQRPTVVLSH